MGAPMIGSRFSGMSGGSPSIGSPRPLNRRPIISLDTPSRATSSRKLIEVLAKSSPVVPSKTWITAFFSDTSITWPPRTVSSGR